MLNAELIMADGVSLLARVYFPFPETWYLWKCPVSVQLSVAPVQSPLIPISVETIPFRLVCTRMRGRVAVYKEEQI